MRERRVRELWRIVRQLSREDLVEVIEFARWLRAEARHGTETR